MHCYQKRSVVVELGRTAQVYAPTHTCTCTCTCACIASRGRTNVHILYGYARMHVYINVHVYGPSIKEPDPFLKHNNFTLDSFQSPYSVKMQEITQQPSFYLTPRVGSQPYTCTGSRTRGWKPYQQKASVMSRSPRMCELLYGTPIGQAS